MHPGSHLGLSGIAVGPMMSGGTRGGTSLGSILINGQKELPGNKRKERVSHNCCYEFEHIQLGKPCLRDVYNIRDT